MGHRKISGLRAHRGKDGRVYWITDTIVGGRPPKGRRVYESWGAIPREEAESYHNDLLDIHWRRVRGYRPPADEPVSYTFEEATRKYLDALTAAGRDPKTIKRYAVDLRWAALYLGGKMLRHIRLDDAERMRTCLRSGLSPDGARLPRVLSYRSRKNVESVTSMLFNFATDAARQWTNQNPFASLVSEKPPRLGKKKGELFRRLHPREDARLLAACDEPWRKCAVAIALYLGVRETPTASLRLDDINVFTSPGTICVPSEFNKGKANGVREDQWLPVPRHLLPHLKAQFEFATRMNSPWLFPTEMVRGRSSESGHIHPHKLRGVAARAAARIGYADGANFHALRAICNNRLRASGIASALSMSAAGARQVLGHASEECARPYIDASVEYLMPVIEAYDRWLDVTAAAGAAIVDIRERTVTVKNGSETWNEMI